MENKYADDMAKFPGSYLENGEIIFFLVSPEIIPASTVILPKRRFVVEGDHPQRGHFALIVQQNELCDWSGKNCPEFVTDEFIERVGIQIEQNLER